MRRHVNWYDDVRTHRIDRPEREGERRNQSNTAAAHQAARHIGIPQCVLGATGIIDRPYQGKARAIAGVAPGTAATEHRATGVARGDDLSSAHLPELAGPAQVERAGPGFLGARG